MSLPPYIELPGSSTYRHPFYLQGMNAQAFYLHASYDKLVALTDKWLNSVPGSEYRSVPLLPFVFCQPVWIDSVRWTPQDAGWMRESDFNFGYFVACFRGKVLDHIAVVMAYLIVDNPLTASTGREVFGYRKVFGQMDYVAGTYQPGAASTWVYKKTGPDEELELAEVARIIPPPAYGAATRHAKFEDLLHLAELVVGDLIIDAITGIQRLIELFKAQNLPVLYLLQLRDVQDPTAAAFQALVESPMQITHVHSAWLLPDGFSIQLTDYASYPLISDLGIKVDAAGRAQSVLSFQSNFDCVLAPGTFLATAGR